MTMADHPDNTHARWNAWATALFNAMFAARVKGLAEATGQVLKVELKKRDDKIAELQRRVTELEQAVAKDSSGDEWPIPIPERNAA